MRRILVTFCTICSFALGYEYGDYDLRQPDYGQARRQQVKLDTSDSGGLTAEDNGNESMEPSLTAEDSGNDSREHSLTAEDNGNESQEPSLTAEDNRSDQSNEPSLTAEDNRSHQSNEPSLTAEDNGNESMEPSLTAEDIGNDQSYEPSLTAEDNGNESMEPNLTDEDNEDQIHGYPDGVNGILDEKRYKVELAAGDPTEFRTGNEHYHDPHFYKNLGRRFVPVYPYTEVKGKSKKTQNQQDDANLKPKWAPRDVVLAVMKKAIKNRPASKPDDEDFKRPNILRSGDYWDGVWKEEVKPENILRTNLNNRHRQTRNKKQLNSRPITAELVPGTKLYALISGVVRHSPRLVYIINDE